MQKIAHAILDVCTEEDYKQLAGNPNLFEWFITDVVFPLARLTFTAGSKLILQQKVKQSVSVQSRLSHVLIDLAMRLEDIRPVITLISGQQLFHETDKYLGSDQSCHSFLKAMSFIICEFSQDQV